MLARVRASLSSWWAPRRRVQPHPLQPQLDPPAEEITESAAENTVGSAEHSPAESVDENTVESSSHAHLASVDTFSSPSHLHLPASSGENTTESSSHRAPSVNEAHQPQTDVSKRALRDLRRSTRIRSRISFAQASRNIRANAALRFATDNTTAEKIEDSLSSHSLVTLFKPHTPATARGRSRRTNFLQAGAFDPFDASFAFDQEVLHDSDSDSEAESESAPAGAPATTAVIPAEVPAAALTTPAPVAPVVSDTSAAASIVPATSTTLAPTPVSAARTVDPAIAVAPTASSTPTASATTTSFVNPSVSLGSSTSLCSTASDGPSTSIGPASTPTTPSAGRPKLGWPKRTRSSASNTDSSAPSRPQKRRRVFIPPHLGWAPLPPIAEETESLSAEGQFTAHAKAVEPDLDIESEPESFSPSKNWEQAFFREFLTPGRHSYSEPPEDTFPSDPMDLDDETYDPNDNHLFYTPPGNVPSANSQPDNATRPLSTSKPKRKSKGQDDDVTYTPARHDRNTTSALLSEDDSDFDIFNIPKNERRDIAFDFAREKDRRLARALDLPDDSWCQAEKELYVRLSMRGFEALLPEHWQFDFRTLPESLFGEPEDGGEPFIRASGSSEFHAIKSLASLFTLGGRVRDCSVLNIRPETVIRRGIRNYLRWAARDGRVRATPEAIPVHAVYCQRKGESTLSAVRKLDRRLQGLARRYVSGQPHPLLTGFAICGPICAILTYDTDPVSGSMGSQDTASKFLCQLDLSDRGQDVWNSLALAIAVVHLRETMAGLAAQGAGGFCSGNGGDEGEDEDL